jgi:hypothetical protein
MFAIAYNLIRAFMLESARAHTACLDRISFKGILSTLRQDKNGDSHEWR